VITVGEGASVVVDDPDLLLGDDPGGALGGVDGGVGTTPKSPNLTVSPLLATIRLSAAADKRS